MLTIVVAYQAEGSRQILSLHFDLKFASSKALKANSMGRHASGRDAAWRKQHLSTYCTTQQGRTTNMRGVSNAMNHTVTSTLMTTASLNKKHLRLVLPKERDQ